ncbi:hypothetical protein FrEUN1fDRAFT_7456, partial [Parafrankia sp. EUN1f]
MSHGCRVGSGQLGIPAQPGHHGRRLRSPTIGEYRSSPIAMPFMLWRLKFYRA